jgi:hypothetical protein
VYPDRRGSDGPVAWRRRTQPDQTLRTVITIIVVVIGSQVLARILLGNEDRPLLLGAAFLIAVVLMGLAFATRFLRFGWERVPD